MITNEALEATVRKAQWIASQIIAEIRNLDIPWAVGAEGLAYSTIAVWASLEFILAVRKRARVAAIGCLIKAIAYWVLSGH